MAVLTGARVLSITIEPDRDDGTPRYGDTEVAWQRAEHSDREHVENGILVSLAGPAAEMTYVGERLHPGFVAEWSQDWSAAWAEAAQLHPSEANRMRYLEQQVASLCDLLGKTNHWAAIAEIADLLLAHDRLEADDVAECVQRWLG